MKLHAEGTACAKARGNKQNKSSLVLLKLKVVARRTRLREWTGVKSHRALWTLLEGKGPRSKSQKPGDAKGTCHSHLDKRCIMETKSAGLGDGVGTRGGSVGEGT